MNKLGKDAEDKAKHWLISQGLHFICANYQTKTGEIDLIMQERNTLVFVEVRQRSHASFGSAAESVTAGKQRKLINTAQCYIQTLNKPQYESYRFDVVAFETSPAQPPPIWYKDAFRL